MNDDALGLGFTFAELAGRDGLIRLDRVFLDRLAGPDPALHARLLAARAAPDRDNPGYRRDGPDACRSRSPRSARRR